jgi:hypothetical protein
VAKRKQRYNSRPTKPRAGRTAEAVAPRPSYADYQREPAKQYGEPFILMEDASKNTFEYLRGAWIPHDRAIADYRVDCQIKELAQKVNRMTRYEIRSPLEPQA